MKKTSVKIVSSLAVLSLVSGCGNSGGGSKSGSNDREEQVAELGLNDGHYQAKFTTLNPHVNGTIPGSANFFRKEDKLYAYVRLFAGGVRAWHMQHVYEGGRCPTLNDDTNLDGFIDIQEAEAVLGKILIPLDSDISSQSSGRRFFPLADLSGYYHYERITSFRRFMSDLESEDKDPTDDVRKLAPGEEFRIVGRTVLIQGVAETVMLPETVGTKGRHRSFQTLPIACGVFQRMDSIPGEAYSQDEIPGPVAEVQEGQDRPADEDTTGTSTGGTAGGSTTGTNDSDDGEGPVSDGEGNTRTTTGGSSGSTDGTSTGGSTTGDSTTGSSTSGGSTTGRTTTGGATTGESTTGGTTGGTSGDTTTTTGGSSSSTTTTTTTSSSSSSTTGSTSAGTTTGGFLDSSSGV